MMIFIEIYPQIHIFSEIRSKIRAKTTNKDTMIIFAEQNIAISKRGIYIALVNEKDSVIFAILLQMMTCGNNTKN